MNRERLDTWCERGILALVLSIMVFGPLANGAVGSLEFLVIQALTLGVMCLWGVRLWVAESPKLLWPPICWVVLLFALYAVGRYLTVELEYVGRWELLRVLVYTFLFFAIVNNLYRQESLQVLIYTMIFVAMGICFIALWQFLTQGDKVPALGAWLESLFFPGHLTWYYERVYTTRGSGTYINPNHLAGFLEMLLPLAVACTVIGRAKVLTKVFLAYAALTIIAGVGVTVSRGSWIAGGVAMLIFFALLAIHRSYRVPSMLMMVLMIAGSTYFVLKTDFFQERFRKALSTDRIEQDVRYQLWESTVRMWQDHYWFGVGPGHYDHRFRPYRPEDVQLRPDRAHNEYLNLLADWGMVGGLIVAAASVLLFVGWCRTWKSVRRPESDFSANLSTKFAIYLGAGLGLFALFLHSAVDFNMQIPANAILAFALVAVVTSQLRHVSERYWVRVGLPLRALVSGMLLVGLGFMGYHEWRLAREYVWLKHAEAANLASPAQIALLEKAHAIEPKNFETTYAIGEAYRLQSWEGAENYRELATNAITWFERGTALNRFDHYNHLRWGMALDWLGRHDEAERKFIHAEALDPKGYFTVAHVGWHFIQVENYAAARPWFERSLRLQRRDNLIAESYLAIANRKLAEDATNAPARFPR